MATLQADWKMPDTPEGVCANCGKPLLPLAHCEDGWEMYWSCEDDCEPFADMFIDWPFGDEDSAEVAELTAIGFVVID